MIYAVYGILYFLVFTVGAVIGSFLNVLIYRIPRKMNFTMEFSKCPSCDHRLYPKDLVPIFSWIFLRGKCRYCGEPISPRYMVVELIMGVVALCAYIFLSLPFAVLVYFVAAILITLSLIDADTQEIPDSLNIALLICGIAAIWIVPDIGLVSRVIGLFAISVPLLAIAFIIPGAFGGGDIKLMAAAGFLLGWQNAIVATFIGLILGGVYGVILLSGKKKGRKDHFAFGPCLAIGIFIGLLFGTDVINWYLGFF